MIQLSQVRLSRKSGGFIGVNVELIRQPKGQNWPTVGGEFTLTVSLTVKCPFFYDFP